jgi:hypothetical protein
LGLDASRAIYSHHYLPSLPLNGICSKRRTRREEAASRRLSRPPDRHPPDAYPHDEANLATLNDEFRLEWIPDLIHRKVNGAEKGKLESGEVEFYSREYRRLVDQLEAEGMHSQLPDEPSCRDALNDLLVRVRLRHATRSAARDSTLRRSVD